MHTQTHPTYLYISHASFSCQVVVEGKDMEGLPFAFINAIHVKVDSKAVASLDYSGQKPFQCLVPDEAKKVVATLEFHSHYGEPPLDIPVDIKAGSGGWSL